MAAPSLSRTHLLRIPQEIRLRIYEFLFHGSEIRVSKRNKAHSAIALTTHDEFGVACSQGVCFLSICRQIRQEALPTFCNAVVLGLGYGVGSEKLDRLVNQDVLSGIKHVYAYDH